MIIILKKDVTYFHIVRMLGLLFTYVDKNCQKAIHYLFESINLLDNLIATYKFLFIYKLSIYIAMINNYNEIEPKNH